MIGIKVKTDDKYAYVTMNYRHIIENGWTDDLKYICEPTEYHEKRVTVRFICDRGVSHEFVRHRVFSFAQESTRYCDYTSRKFSNECTFIIPCWTTLEPGLYEQYDDENYSYYPDDYTDCERKMQVDKDWNTLNPQDEFLTSVFDAEYRYRRLRSFGWTAQQARTVLPNSLKTELVMTGFVSDWKHFFDLRCASSAHPQAQELAKPLHEEFIKRKYIND